MPNYLHTVIYKIEHKENKELVYVGSTTNFYRRKGEHKSSLKNEKKYNLKLYVMIRENGDWNSFEMLEIKKFPCNNKREVEAEEERCRVELKATMNKNRAFGNKPRQEQQKQWYEENKEKISEQRKEYYEANKEKIAEQQKKYIEEHKEKITEKVSCECGSIYTMKHKARHFQSEKHQHSIDV